MKTNKILAILLTLLGVGLIAVVFFWIIPEDALAQNAKILSFIITTIVFSLWAYTFTSPIVDMNDKSQQQIGGLGIKWNVLGTYSIIALLAVLIFIVCNWKENPEVISFPIQVGVQAFLLFFLLIGLFTAKSSADHTGAVYRHEEQLKAGKADVKRALAALLRSAEDSPGVPGDIKQRISHLNAETRYITPSTSAEAVELDKEIEDLCGYIIPSFFDYEMNKDVIDRTMSQIERNLDRRRKAF